MKAEDPPLALIPCRGLSSGRPGGWRGKAVPNGVGAREHDQTTSVPEHEEWRNTLNETTEDAAAESRQRETQEDGWPSFFHREIARKSEGDERGTYRFKKDLGDKAITMDRPTNKWVM